MLADELSSATVTSAAPSKADLDAAKSKLASRDQHMSALDEQSRILLGDELVSIWRQVRRTIVFVTHSLTEAVYLGQRIAVFTARWTPVPSHTRT